MAPTVYTPISEVVQRDGARHSTIRFSKIDFDREGNDITWTLVTFVIKKNPTAGALDLFTRAGKLDNGYHIENFGGTADQIWITRLKTDENKFFLVARISRGKPTIYLVPTTDNEYWTKFALEEETLGINVPTVPLDWDVYVSPPIVLPRIDLPAQQPDLVFNSFEPTRCVLHPRGNDRITFTVRLNSRDINFDPTNFDSNVWFNHGGLVLLFTEDGFRNPQLYNVGKLIHQRCEFTEMNLHFMSLAPTMETVLTCKINGKVFRAISISQDYWSFEDSRDMPVVFEPVRVFKPGQRTLRGRPSPKAIAFHITGIEFKTHETAMDDYCASVTIQTDKCPAVCLKNLMCAPTVGHDSVEKFNARLIDTVPRQAVYSPRKGNVLMIAIPVKWILADKSEKESFLILVYTKGNKDVTQCPLIFVMYYDSHEFRQNVNNCEFDISLVDKIEHDHLIIDMNGSKYTTYQRIVADVSLDQAGPAHKRARLDSAASSSSSD